MTFIRLCTLRSNLILSLKLGIRTLIVLLTVQVTHVQLHVVHVLTTFALFYPTFYRGAASIRINTMTCISPPTVTPPPIPSREPATVAVCEPVTTDQLFSFLLPHASKWQSLGIALSLDDDRLDEVYTNNERDEDCLREMLELYMLRSDLNHSWEEIQAALGKMESSCELTVFALIIQTF